MPGKYIKIGEVLTCNCNVPLAKRVSKDIFQVMRFHKGEKISVNILHGGQGIHTIGCSTCGYKYTCVGLIDTLSVSGNLVTS